MAGFAVRHPNGSIAHPYEVKQWSSYGDNNSTGGYYSFCVYNQYSTYAAKIVAMYISSMKMGGWQQYEKELEELHLNIKNFTVSHSPPIFNINIFDETNLFVRPSSTLWRGR